MLPYSKGAALVVKTLKSLEDAQQTIQTARALLAIMDLSPVESMLAQALCLDSVWTETMRTQLRQAESGKPGYAHLQGQLMSTGFYLRVLLPKAEQVAMTAGDAEVAERHLARALVDMLSGDLRRQAIDGERLVAEVTAMESGPEEERIKQALELERLQFSRAQDELRKSARGESAVAQSDSQRRGILDSSIHTGRITEIHIEMLSEMARTWMRTRRVVAQTVQPLASSARLKSLRQEIERMVDEQWANLHIAIARWCGGVHVESEIQRLLGTPGYIAKWQEIKDAVARELGILEREASLGMTRAVSIDIHTGHTFHNINVDRSVIGAINTGVVESLDVAMTNIRVGGDQQLADALRRMTEAVIQSTDLATAQKNESLDHLAVIAEQAARPREQRNIGALKAIIQAFERIIQNSAALLSLWQQFGQRIVDLLK